MYSKYDFYENWVKLIGHTVYNPVPIYFQRNSWQPKCLVATLSREKYFSCDKIRNALNILPNFNKSVRKLKNTYFSDPPPEPFQTLLDIKINEFEEGKKY